MYGEIKVPKELNKENLIKLIHYIGYTQYWCGNDKFIDKFGEEVVGASFNGWVWYEDKIDSATKEELLELLFRIVSIKQNHLLKSEHALTLQRNIYKDKCRESGVMSDEEINKVFWDNHISIIK